MNDELARALAESRQLSDRVRVLEERVLNMSAPEQHIAWTAPRGFPSIAISFTANSEISALDTILVPLPLTGILRARRLMMRAQNQEVTDILASCAIYRASDGKSASRDLASVPSDEGEVEVSHEIIRSPLSLVRDLGVTSIATGGTTPVSHDFQEVQMSPWRTMYFIAMAFGGACRMDAPTNQRPTLGWRGPPLDSTLRWPQTIQPVRHADFTPAIGLISARGAQVWGGG